MVPTSEAPPRRPVAGRNPLESLLRRLGLNDYTLFLLLSALVGLATGGVVVLFKGALIRLTAELIGGGHVVVDAVRAAPAWRVLLVPTAGAVVVGAIVRYGPRGGPHHGVAAVIDAVAFTEGRISFRRTLSRFVTHVLSIASGASVGPEGPVIELGAGVGSAVGRRLRLSPERVRTLVGCGAAAGLAAAFNAPIAGAIFALEVVLRDFAVVTFSPIIVAAVISTAVGRRFLGDAPAFQAPPYELVSLWELPLYVLLGVLAGLWGTLFSRTHHAFERLAARLPLPRLLLAGLGGLLLGGALLLMPELYGVGYEPTTRLLHGHMAWMLMLLLLGAKLLATNTNLATGFTGGIFAPILVMGGALGGAYGMLMGQLFPGHVAPLGAYSLVGMAALMAAITYAPLTSILILFEMTGGYEVILPLMLACIGALAVAQSISKDSIFTLGFANQGIDLNYGRESAVLRRFYVEDLMHAELPRFRLDTDFDTILQGFLGQMDSRYYVVDADERLEGVIDIHHVKDMVAQQGLGKVVIAADLMRPVHYFAQRRENLEDAILLLGTAEQEELPVVDNAENRRLVGTIDRGDILELYNREILHKEILGIKMVHQDTHATDFVDLPGQYAVELLPVGPREVGRTLAELDLRGRFGVHVIAIKRPGRRAQGENELPDPRRPLDARDRLIVVGRSEDVERLMHPEEGEA